MDSGKEELVIFYNEISQPSRAVKTMAEIGKIPHNEVLLNILTAENKEGEFVKINHRGQVPFIKHGDLVLTESAAIMKYFCDSFDSIPETWYPKDLVKRAEVEKYLEWGQ